MNKKLILLLVAFLPLFALAQQSYPYYIEPGQTSQLGPAQDTLWVLKHSQMQRALIFGKENKLLKQEIEILKKKVVVRKDINIECDSLVALHQKDALFYKDKWLASDKDLQIVVKKYKRQKLFKNVFLGGMVASFFLGAFLFH